MTHSTETTHEVEVDAVSGRLVVLHDGEDTDFHRGPSGTVRPTTAELEPWGVDEEDFDRADAALSEMGWRRVGDFVDTTGAGQYFRAPVSTTQTPQET